MAIPRESQTVGTDEKEPESIRSNRAVREHPLIHMLKKRGRQKSRGLTSCFFGSFGLGGAGTPGTAAALLFLTRTDPLEFLSPVVS